MMENKLEQSFQELEKKRIHLSAASPMATLARGYAIVLSEDRVIKSAKEAPDRMTLQFVDGRLDIEQTTKKGAAK